MHTRKIWWYIKFDASQDLCVYPGWIKERWYSISDNKLRYVWFMKRFTEKERCWLNLGNRELAFTIYNEFNFPIAIEILLAIDLCNKLDCCNFDGTFSKRFKGLLPISFEPYNKSSTEYYSAGDNIFYYMVPQFSKVYSNPMIDEVGMLYFRKIKSSVINSLFDDELIDQIRVLILGRNPELTRQVTQRLRIDTCTYGAKISSYYDLKNIHVTADEPEALVNYVKRFNGMIAKCLDRIKAVVLLDADIDIFKWELGFCSGRGLPIFTLSVPEYLPIQFAVTSSIEDLKCKLKELM